MPRAQKHGPKPESKPYTKQETADDGEDGSPWPSPRTKPKSTYNKTFLVQLVLKDAKPDWDAIALETGKTSTQCRDLWRKVVHANLIANKPWSDESKEWSKTAKVLMLCRIIESAKPDWAMIAEALDGRTPVQVRDVWRKVVLPRLKKGNTIE